MRAALTSAGATPEQLPALLAHTAIETARWRSLQNHNVGNISADDTSDVEFWRPTWFEVDDSSSERDKRLHELMLQHKEPRAFRSYSSLDAGAAAYYDLLNRRFPNMLEAANDPAAFVQAWGERYTPRLDEDATLPGFRALWRKFGGRLAPAPASGATLLGLSIAALAGFVFFSRR